MNRNPDFHLTYDDEGDVLYIAKGRAIAARGIEDENGIVWRYDGGGELIAATVLAFREFWSNDRARLALQLSAGFHISIDEARNSVDDAFEAKASLT